MSDPSQKSLKNLKTKIILILDCFNITHRISILKRKFTIQLLFFTLKFNLVLNPEFRKANFTVQN